MNKDEIKVGDCFKSRGGQVRFMVREIPEDHYVEGIAVTRFTVDTISERRTDEFYAWQRIDRAEFESAFAAIRDEVQEALKTK